jgi:transcriptional regulator with XRE-family HTH domain
MALGSKIRRHRLERGLTLDQLAELSGVDTGTISALELRDSSRSKYAQDLARALGMTMDALMSDAPGPSGQVIPAHEDDSSQGVKIPQFDTGGSMGRGVLLRDQPGVIQSWTVSDAWLVQNVHRMTAAQNLCIVTGFGPSMQPLFNPGDPLLVDRGIKRVDVDAVYFFRIGEEGFIKQVQRLYQGKDLVLRAKSYNPMYDPFDIPQTNDFEVFGRVLKVWEGKEF